MPSASSAVPPCPTSPGGTGSPGPRGIPPAGTTMPTWPASGWPSSGPGLAPSSSYPRSPRPRRVYQRSAPYVLPKADRPYRDAEHALYDRLPVVRKADRVRIFLEQSAQRASEGTWSEKQTEQIILAAARVGQHVFALNVLSSCGQRCVFCGLNPSAFTPSACSWPDISSRGKTASPAGAWTAGTDSPPAQPRRHLRHGAVDRRLSLHQR